MDSPSGAQARACTLVSRETKKKAGTRRATPRRTICVCCQTPRANIAASRNRLGAGSEAGVVSLPVADRRRRAGVRFETDFPVRTPDGYGAPRASAPTRYDPARLGNGGRPRLSASPRRLPSFPREASALTLDHIARRIGFEPLDRLAFVRSDQSILPLSKRGRIGARLSSHCSGGSAWFRGVLLSRRARVSSGLKALYPRKPGAVLGPPASSPADTGAAAAVPQVKRARSARAASSRKKARLRRPIQAGARAFRLALPAAFA